MTTWVLEANVFAEVCFDRMVAHLSKRNLPYHVVKVIPFIHEIEGKAPEITGPVVVYGSIGVQKLARKHGWSPGVFPVCTEEETKARLGDIYLNADLSRMMISEAAEHVRSLGHDEDFFIKPDTDTKEFAGEVMKGYDFVPWYAKMKNIGYLDENDFPVVISKAKTIGCEWRVVVVDGKISSYSLYRQWQRVMPEHHILPEVEDLVLKAHARFAPAPVYVIDVCQVGDEFKVIEYNTFNSSGLYECEVEKIIDDINEYIEASCRETA